MAWASNTEVGRDSWRQAMHCPWEQKVKVTRLSSANIVHRQIQSGSICQYHCLGFLVSMREDYSDFCGEFSSDFIYFSVVVDFFFLQTRRVNFLRPLYYVACNVVCVFAKDLCWWLQPWFWGLYAPLSLIFFKFFEFMISNILSFYFFNRNMCFWLFLQLRFGTTTVYFECLTVTWRV